MALNETELHGNTTLSFGFQSADAPTISGYFTHTAEVKFTPEVNANAQDGEGHVFATAISKPANRMIDVTLTGYAATTLNAQTIVNNFTFLGRFFLIGDISAPKKKGEFNEYVIQAKSYAGVTS